MDFTKEQLSDVFVKHLERERGLQELMELMIESMLPIFGPTPSNSKKRYTTSALDGLSDQMRAASPA